MQTVQQISNSVSAKPLCVLIREEIEELRAAEETVEQISEIRRLEELELRVRELDALGERILAAVIAEPAPVDEAPAPEPQLRGAIGATERRLATPAAAKPRQRATRKPAKQAATA